ncbi:7-cyano-7-deazaguanine/7-aminomethyl-7-deazaguanine transporter [Serratia symbiotica]|uniref:Probable queuosine precursor transporter n=1 Tax=Serratia symbiotica SCt-VLC TaxID=1347341 RepID=A0A068RC95_9GAMM|nr:7-cyano-7-deazaguanine/7-aminomethyl-7-deazaguanine transporter [Serratia symbiotica]CDG48348.1 Inner membrane protein YhhQ [Serratia symbiotica SCt-VLC]
MYSFTAQQRLTALLWLSLFHIAIITSSNYLVQLPITIFGCHTTWGAFTFPFIFLATDLTVRIFGAPLARRIVLSVMVPALFISYVISTVTYQGEWQGFSALGSFNLFVARISIASFMAYVLGQILDVHVFNRLRQCSTWWVAPAAAMLLGNISDTLSFFFIAFYHSSDVFMAANWVEIALVDYSFKVLICMLFFLPMYGMLLNVLLKRITVHGDGLQRNLKFEENL